MLKILLVGTGGFIGSIARYWLSGLVQQKAGMSFPAGTLVVNVVGCFIVGVLAYLFDERQLFTPNARLLLIVGVLGGFTTFSAFGNETFALMRDRSFGLVLCNIGGSVILGLIAVWLGRAAGKTLGI